MELSDHWIWWFEWLQWPWLWQGRHHRVAAEVWPRLKTEQLPDVDTASVDDFKSSAVMERK